MLLLHYLFISNVRNVIFPIPELFEEEPHIVYPTERETQITSWPQGVMLSLPCVATGSHAFSLNWYKDEEPIHNNDETR